MQAIRWMVVVFAAAALAGCQGNGLGGIFGGGDDRESSASGSGASGSSASAGASAGQAVSPELVRKVQQALKEQNIDGGPVDGVWGEQTQQGVREFQKKQGLEANGKLDPQTLSALGISEGGSAATGGSASGQSQGGAASGQSQSGSQPQK